jgi:predicted nucleic acid-binding protein
MSGNRYFIDTNIALYLLSGDEAIIDLLNEQDIYISVITEMELLCYKDLTEKDIIVIKEFIQSCIVIELNQMIKENTIRIKKLNKIKLPDAIIASTSLFLNIPLITADLGFKNINEIQTVIYNKVEND